MRACSDPGQSSHQVAVSVTKRPPPALTRHSIFAFFPAACNDGAVAEWSREDTEAVYTGAFLAWGDIDAHSHVSNYGNTNAVKEIGMWLAEQKMVEGD